MRRQAKTSEAPHVHEVAVLRASSRARLTVTLWPVSNGLRASLSPGPWTALGLQRWEILQGIALRRKTVLPTVIWRFCQRFCPESFLAKLAMSSGAATEGPIYGKAPVA